MYVVLVIPFLKSSHKETLTYFTKEEITLGSIVAIPYRKKKIHGVVIKIEDLVSKKDEIKKSDFQLRKVLSVLKGPFLGDEVFEISQSLSDYYVSSQSRVLDFIIPEIILSDYDKFIFSNEKITPKPRVHEKLIFQAPLQDRISWYKTHIRESFAKHQSVYICVPNIRDINFFEEQLSKGIENYVFTLSSEMTKKDKVRVWNEAIEQEHAVVIIGTPQYSIIPRADIATVIIERERSNSYKGLSSPSFDFRIVIELLARARKQKCIFADTLLRIETSERLRRSEVSEIMPLVYRIDNDVKLSLVRIKKPENNSKSFEVLSDEVKNRISNSLNKNEHIFVFALRGGLSTITKCKDCGEILSCEYCSSPLVLYQTSKDSRVFICNKCKRHTPADSNCKNCGSWNLLPLGIGIEKVYSEIENLYGSKNLYKIDGESIKTYKDGEKIFNDFMKQSTGILVGTEKAFSYLHGQIDRSIVCSFDSLFNIPSFRIGERILNLITNLKENTQKEIIIQTRNDGDLILDTIEKESTSEWYRTERNDREKFLYPPFGTLIKIQKRGTEEEIDVARKYLGDILKEYDPDIFVLGGRDRNGRYILNAVLRIDYKRWSLPENHIGSLLDGGLKRKLQEISKIALVYVDPEDLLS